MKPKRRNLEVYTSTSALHSLAEEVSESRPFSRNFVRLALFVFCVIDQAIQHWAYFVDFSCKRSLPVLSDHFVLHQGWSLTRELTVHWKYSVFRLFLKRVRYTGNSWWFKITTAIRGQIQLPAMEITFQAGSEKLGLSHAFIVSSKTNNGDCKADTTWKTFRETDMTRTDEAGSLQFGQLFRTPPAQARANTSCSFCARDPRCNNISTIEPPVATTSRHQPVFQNTKIKFPSQITVFVTSPGNLL